MIKTVGAFLGVLAIICGTLVLALGIFWTIDLAPLVLFVGAAIAYGVLSSPRRATRHRESADVTSGQKPSLSDPHSPEREVHG